MSKHRKGRGINHGWQFVKYKTDMAIYAMCCGCGYSYRCDKYDGNNGLKLIPYPEMLYRYCPICGAKKKWYIDKIKYIDKYVWE